MDRLVNLDQLWLGKNKITNIQNLEHCTKLTKVSIQVCTIPLSYIYSMLIIIIEQQNNRYWDRVTTFGQFTRIVSKSQWNYSY